MPDARGMVSIRRVLVWKDLDPGRTDAQYPAITLKDKRNYNYYVSTNTKFNVAYARLKNLQFGYTIPQTLTSKAVCRRCGCISPARIYLRYITRQMVGTRRRTAVALLPIRLPVIIHLV